jgi:hypothetical protein
MFTITLPSGEEKKIKISMFPALDGWDLQNRFVEFASSTNGEVRRIYTMDVLSYAKVVVNGGELPLSTDALIDNHLQTWQNVKSVFEEILAINGINPATHAEKPHYWADAGAEMATAFIAATASMIGPAMAAFENGAKG